jgi:hypothetical protein
LVLDVASYGATRLAKKTIVTVSSELGITGKGSSSMIITFGIEFFINHFESRFLMVLIIVSTLVLKGVAKSKETDK